MYKYPTVPSAKSIRLLLSPPRSRVNDLIDYKVQQSSYANSTPDMSTAVLLDSPTSHVESPVVIEANKETTTAVATERTLTSVDKGEVAEKVPGNTEASQQGDDDDDDDIDDAEFEEMMRE
ncbi:hypothetical protein PHLGIDRAFT_129080 [Phlebiopsis gigantea 11061_1 CR5-6]|uniref:Uncharacterized protein n=1 Tax=Phlebiopsis gigantea (strain 11061_1 CR5-6) TaxID=745531 RepID=A0A0C3PH31_PHLG1|nr:hypothetical protein PHLGIDRAFT_129080 [Phlebiopsis gigantea 11061_1 CR5-6]